MIKRFSALFAVIFLLTSVFSFSVFAVEDEEGDGDEPEDLDITTDSSSIVIPEESDSKDGELSDADNEPNSKEDDLKNEEPEDDPKITDTPQNNGKKNIATRGDAPKNKVVTAQGSAKWFSSILGFFTNNMGYIVGILVFALIVKVIIFPLAIKQQKNSQKMAKLAPKQEAIRKKYAGRNDRATQMKMNEEIQKLYADEKFNPMGGCLPLLLQLPIIFLLYSAINAPITSNYDEEAKLIVDNVLTYNAEEYGFDISEKDYSLSQSDALGVISENMGRVVVEGEVIPEELAEKAIVVTAEEKETLDKLSVFYDDMTIGGFNFMRTPSFTPIYNALVPLLVFLSSFFSTKLIRKFTYNPNGAQADASMKIMDWTMPLMILWFSFNVPVLIGIYWIFQNALSVIQQILLSKLYPVKGPTPEEIREAELLMKGRRPKNHDNDEAEEKNNRKPAVSKAPIKKKKSNSPFIYARKGIDEKFLAKVKEKGAAPKAKRKP